MDSAALPLTLRAFADEGSSGPGAAQMEHLTLEEAEKHLIRSAMERAGNNMTRAARQLGITRRTMGYRLRKYGMYERTSDRGNGR